MTQQNQQDQQSHRIQDDSNIRLLFFKTLEYLEQRGGDTGIGKLFEAMRQYYWDMDENDFRTVVAHCFSNKEIFITFDRKIKLIENPKLIVIKD